MKKKKYAQFFSLLLFMAFLLIYPAESLASTPSLTSGGTSAQPSLSEISGRLTYWADQYNIPPVLLKAVAWKESSWRQFDSSGQTFLSADGKGIGIMQISDANYAALNLSQDAYRAKLMTDYDFNISEGARILSQKWRTVPKMGDGDRNKIENWYLAVWAYNGWSDKNNPTYAKAHGLIPYQDKVMALINSQYNSTITFTSPVTLPDPSLFPQAPLDQTFAAATLAPNFLATYDTPQPYHYGDLQIDLNRLLSSGGTSAEQANGDYWAGISGGSQALNALNFYVTGYNSTKGSEQAQFASKLESAAQTVYSGALSKLNNPANNLDLFTAKRAFYALAQLPGIDAGLKQNALNGLAQVTQKISVRLSGPAREDTAIAIAQEGWPQGAHTVVLVNSSDQSWADSVVAVPLAVHENAPVLLTPSATLPAPVLNEINALRPQNIILVGGTGVISKDIEQSLKSSYPVTRYGASDRYGTAVQIAQALGPSSSGAVLVNASDTPDAIAVASLAGNAGQPILYSDPLSLPQATADFIKTNSIKALTVIGNTQLISDAALPQTTVNTRYGGSDRFATLLEMIKGYNPPIKNIFLAYGAGDSFADGLAGGPLVARLGGILLYAGHNALDSRIAAYLKEIGGYAMLDKNGGKIYEFGGAGVLAIDPPLSEAFQP